ncbi:hypothetical protein [uncultured Deinococcus sp.]|uniref:hypothetical protein n=1 Tax=uncultured Deinococcus sp. TaxID=158789 RepID=UPI002584333B|nr:hypothetical protein [uncultured Deinococcus sp.]
MTPLPLPLLDILSAAALALLVSGIAGVTYRAFALLHQLIPPKPRWLERGVLLVLLALAYAGMLLLDVPSILVALTQNSGDATVTSVLRTLLIGAWMWTLNTILLMLARGQLAPRRGRA